MIKYEYFCGNDLVKLLEQVSDEIDETKIININKRVCDYLIKRFEFNQSLRQSIRKSLNIDNL